ncbi:protein of unknown function [Chitinophaga eiseniae]|uniref:Lin1244/Lin1753-like N-terminal domain-containing protein n=1 Tax=Chitinophaga eiseniae TaxID=634771 RepID=A0A1T4SP49_9BACT|nr:DUF4373 domain-containing protein [Chitinophaga eiseniae]SKA30074.1 protein of unknown function [Chitinophaga eiseniae]
MANNKTGFIYYSVETDRYQDIRIKRLKKECGCAGLATYDYLLCEIYRVKGCFLEWDDSTVFDVADYLGLKENTVREIVNYCCSVGLFNKELLASGNVLTSASIQSRFIDWSKKAKRANVTIPEKARILPEESPNLPEESGKLQEECKQSKVKESKVKKRRDYAPAEFPEGSDSGTNSTFCRGAPRAENFHPAPPHAGPRLEDVKRYFRGAGGTEEMAEKFYNKWDSTGWIYNGSKIVRWAGLANTFIVNYREIEERDGRKTTTTGNKPPSGGTKAFNGKNGGFEIIAGQLKDELSSGGTAGDPNEI